MMPGKLDLGGQGQIRSMSVSHLLQPGCQRVTCGKLGASPQSCARLALDQKTQREIRKDLEKPGAALANTDDQQIAGSWNKQPPGPGALWPWTPKNMTNSPLPPSRSHTWGLICASTTSDPQGSSGPHGSSLAKLMQCERMAVLRGKPNPVFYGSHEGMIFTVRGCR